MLKQDDRDAIEGLFDRLDTVERRGGARDPEAEELIHRKIARQPGAPYFMAQTILVQEHALSVAEERIAELERRLDDRHGQSYVRSDAAADHRGGGREERGMATRGPWGRMPDREEQDRYAEDRSQRRGYGGGGFLAGAAQTAMGVAGGVLLGQAIGSLFGAGAAQASEGANTDTQGNNDQPDQPADQNDAGNDPGDAGGFDDGGGFDTGGDF